MRAGLLIIILSILVIAVVFILTLPKRARFVSMAALIMILLVMAVGVLEYFRSAPFRYSVNLNFDRSSEYTYYLGDETYSLPLPQKTTFGSRSSETAVSYMTRASEDTVSNLYSGLAESGTFVKSSEGEKQKLCFRYNGENFTVTIEKYNSKINRLDIDFSN